MPSTSWLSVINIIWKIRHSKKKRARNNKWIFKSISIISCSTIGNWLYFRWTKIILDNFFFAHWFDGISVSWRVYDSWCMIFKASNNVLMMLKWSYFFTRQQFHFCLSPLRSISVACQFRLNIHRTYSGLHALSLFYCLLNQRFT